MPRGSRGDMPLPGAEIDWADILDFEGGWEGGASKAAAVRRRFGMSPTRYYQVLNLVIEQPAALRHDPMLVRRLRRLRDARRRKRFAPRLDAQERHGFG